MKYSSKHMRGREKDKGDLFIENGHSQFIEFFFLKLKMM